MPGQSLRVSRSSKRRFVAKSLISDAGLGFRVCCLVLVLAEMMRELPWMVVVVAAEELEADLDMFEEREPTSA